MSLDVVLLIIMRQDGWTSHGACFKNEATYTARETNQQRFSEVLPWSCWLAVASRDDSEMYWLFSR
jgi:hypothetical protein